MTINRDDLLALALGLLNPEEEARVQAALDADPALMAEYRADLDALHRLPDDLPPAEVPAGAEERLMARLNSAVLNSAVASTSAAAAGPAPASVPLFPDAPGLDAGRADRSERRSPWLNWRGGLLALVAAVAVGVLLIRPPQSTDPLSEFARAPGSVTQELATAGQPLGQLIRLPDGRAYLHLTAAAPEKSVYQLWRIENETPVSAGVFDGQGIVIPALKDGQTIAVSVEPPGGSRQPTTQPILVQSL
ncbi:anti-sigma E factor [Deinococcus seoulensis]|uniref:Anti-sigma E factor n=1 Tax=Deinococcus seoulensis TaxID=1837379 RepID=A0ABQ2RTC3_9DEIO|nr:anti-sigma factor [Deinococcus seoulensis]GGR63915.1 anti-sigma E factor [Deinococcus seoulensis]